MNHAESAADIGHWTLAQRIRGVVGACGGNLIEWFDFYVYSATSIYFAASFFPSGDQVSQLLGTAIIFAVGFFMRPLGGWIFGRMADRKGRRHSMLLSIGLMCIGSFLVAILPTHAQIGVAAPILLALCRMLQGLSVGAQYGTGATYLSEVGSKGRRGLLGSLQYVTLIGGQLLALTLLGVLQYLLTTEEMKAWGWRIPFAVGGLGGVVLLLMRSVIKETATRESMKNKDAGSIRLLWAGHKRAVILILLFTCGGSLYFYTFTTYMQKFLVLSSGIPAATVSWIMTAALICYGAMQMLMGWVCDRIGAKSNMLIATSLSMVCAAPLLYALRATHDPLSAFFLVMAGLTIGAFYTAISGYVKADMFPITVRALGVGLPYAIGNAMFGGTAESVALYLRQRGIDDAFFWYVGGINALAFLASVAMPNLRKHGYLDGDGRVEENVLRFGRSQ
jgi:MHS family alpha-ketoglutarate permease-like MFS transporter